MSFAHYFRVKAQLFGMLLDKSTNAVDRAWYEGLVRSYNLLAASEDRHYYDGLRAVPLGNLQTLSAEAEPADLEGDIATVIQSQIKRPAA